MYVTTTHINGENRKLQHIQFILLQYDLVCFCQTYGAGLSLNQSSTVLCSATWLSKVRIEKTRQSHIVARLSLYCGCIVAKIVIRLGLDEGEMVSILCPKFG